MTIRDFVSDITGRCGAEYDGGMSFLIEPPLLPMLAKRVDKIPAGDAWSFEPKWDGFRAVIFRDGDELLIQSRDGKPLDRYFPELRVPLLSLAERYVLDGEIVIAGPDGLDFDALSQRIHPAASRVKMLSETTPASVVFFDLLAVGDEDLREKPFAERRARLEAVFAARGAVEERDALHLTPATREVSVAEDWFSRFEGAGLDGVMAKPLSGPYTPDKRTMLKLSLIHIYPRQRRTWFRGYRRQECGACVARLKCNNK